MVAHPIRRVGGEGHPVASSCTHHHLAVAMLCLMGAPALAHAQAYAPCRPVDAAAIDDRAMIAGIVAGGDSIGARRRQGWNLPAVADSEVTFVVEPALCTAAAAAHARVHDVADGPLLPVHVLRVGLTRYVVFNYTPVGEYFAYVVFDGAWTVVATIIG